MRKSVLDLSPLWGAVSLVLAACAAGPPASTAIETPEAALGHIDTSSSTVSQRQLARLNVPSSEELIGMAGADLKDLFGEPSLARDEKNAKVWQYAHGGCILLFFLYEEPRTARFSVTHVDARAPKKGPAPVEECISHAFKSHYVAKAPL